MLFSHVTLSRFSCPCCILLLIHKCFVNYANLVAARMRCILNKFEKTNPNFTHSRGVICLFVTPCENYILNSTLKTIISFLKLEIKECFKHDCIPMAHTTRVTFHSSLFLNSYFILNRPHQTFNLGVLLGFVFEKAASLLLRYGCVMFLSVPCMRPTEY